MTLGFSSRDRTREEKIAPLLILKRKLEKDKIHFQTDMPDNMIWLDKKMDDILFKMTEMEKKLEGLKRERISDMIHIQSGNPYDLISKESPRKAKMKKMMKALIEEHGKLSSMDIGKMVSLSRTRCSEYLNEMERARIIKGATVRRKRFYEIVK